MSSYRMKYRIGNTDYHIPVQQDISSGIPIATVLPYASNLSIPEGFFLCDGRALSRSVYPVLFSRIGTVYGEGDGSTTFNIPDFTGRFAEGALTAGVAKSAGLPNITGSLELVNSSYTMFLGHIESNGALSANYETRYRISAQSQTDANYTSKISIDASDSNAIYGNSQTVQPPSLTVKYIIKAYDASPSQSQSLASSLGEYLTDISNKGYRDLSNLTQAGEDHFLENDFTIVYPNNGSESSPANVSTQSTYVSDNPFSGYQVQCQAEVMVSSQWYVAPYMAHEINGSYYGSGVYCYQYNDSLVLKTGSLIVTGATDYQYTVQPNAIPISFAHLTSAPCRIKVWKVGKLPT